MKLLTITLAKRLGFDSALTSRTRPRATGLLRQSQLHGLWDPSLLVPAAASPLYSFSLKSQGWDQLLGGKILAHVCL